MDKKLYQELFDDLLADVDFGLQECEKTLYSPKFQTFAQFKEDLISNLKCSTCTTSWHNSLAGRCYDCMIEDNSVVCIPCFLKGGHLNHHYAIIRSPSGNCDCGDPHYWKKSGFCPEHQGQQPNPDLNQISTDLRKKFITVFAAVFTCSITKLNDHLSSFLKAISWLQQFPSLGDASRRCLSISILDHSPIVEYFKAIPHFPPEAVVAVDDLFGGLLNDEYFGIRAVTMYYPLDIDLRKDYFDNIKKNYDSKEVENYVSFFEFIFHFYAPHLFQEAVKKNHFDWPNYFIQRFSTIRDFLSGEQGDYIANGKLTPSLWTIPKCYKQIQNDESQKKALQTFINKFAKFCREITGAIHYHMCFTPEDDFDMKWTQWPIAQIYIDNISQEVDPTKFSVVPVFQEFKELVDALYTSPPDYTIGIPDPSIPVENRIEFTILYPLHTLVSIILMKTKDFSAFDKLMKDPEYCYKAPKLVLEWLTSVFLQHYNILINCHHTIKHFLNIADVLDNFSVSFAFCQLCFAHCNDKSRFIDMIARLFGIYVNGLIDQAYANLTYSFFRFIASMILDRTAIDNDTWTQKRLTIQTSLKLKPRSISDIEKLGDKKLSDQRFADDVMSYAQIVQTSSGSTFKLVDDSDWHAVQYWQKKGKINDIIDRLDKNVLVPFPDFQELNISNCELRSALSAPSLMGIMYKAVSDYVTTQKSGTNILQFVFNLFLVMHRNSKSRSMQSVEIEADTLESLIAKIPPNVIAFMNCPIKYLDRKQATFIELIAETGPLGETCLTRASIKFVSKIKAEEIKVHDKGKAETIKTSIMNEFKQKQKAFTEQIGVEKEKATSICSVCQIESDDILGYPVFSSHTNLPSLMKKKLKNSEAPEKILMFMIICAHPVHISCVNKERYRACPIDRCIRNTVIPKMPDDITSKPNDQYLEAITYFLKSAFGEKEDRDLIIQSFVGHIEILEVRHRSRPDCLDSPNISLLLQNLFRVIYTHFRGFSSISCHECPLEELIYQILLSNDPVNDYNGLVNGVAETISVNEDRYEFLRRTAILEHFCLKPLVKSTGFIDWDEILCFDSLNQHYNLPRRPEVELPIFRTVELPKGFLQLYQPPYNINIFSEDEMLYNLLTGDIVTRESKPNQNSLTSYLEEHGYGGAIFLWVTGKNASGVCIPTLDINSFCFAKGIYINRFGDEDRGFKTGLQLELSEDRVELLLDRYMSGEYLNIQASE